MREWNKTKVGEFLFERAGKYKPDAEEIVELKRIDKIDFSGNFHIAQKPSKTNMILIKPGDLVVSGINVAKGAMGIYGGNEDVTATIHYSSYTFDKNQISVEYFKRFLRSPEFINLLKEQVKGGIKTEIKPKHLLPLEISLPTLEKQQDIASHFQKFESGKDKLKNEITHQQTLLKKLRQQILQEAIQGELTTDFRAQNPDIEPAGELLARIKAEKNQLIKDKKIKNQKTLPPISEEEIPFELPEGWVWCHIGDISFSIVPNRDKPKSFTGSIPWVTIVDIDDNSISLTYKSGKGLSLNETKNYNARVMPEGAVLTGCVGRYGIAALITKSIVANQQLHCFVPLCNVDSAYIAYSIKVQKLYFENIAIQTTLKYVNKTKMESMLLTLPPLSEQKAIVTKVEKLLSICDQLETQITTDQTHTEQLMQAVLKEAFSQSGEA